MSIDKVLQLTLYKVLTVVYQANGIYKVTRLIAKLQVQFRPLSDIEGW